MLIKCPNCGHDNQLGAIFCRNCGDKLDIESFRPKVSDQKLPGAGLFGIIRRLIGVVILLLLIGVIVLMFLPGSMPGGELSADQKEEADTRYAELVRRLDGGFGKDVYSFSPSEATYLYNHNFVKQTEEEGGKAYNIQKLAFSIDPSGYTHLILATKLGGKLPVTFELKGSIPPPAGEGGKLVEAVDATSDFSVQFTVAKAKMGRMSMPGFAHGKIIGKFQPALAGAMIEKLQKQVGKVEISENNDFILTLVK